MFNQLLDKIEKWARANSSEVSVDIGFDILDIDAVDLQELITYLHSLKIQ